MLEITPEQNGQLSEWAAQRDSLLSGISALRVETESIEKRNRELAASNTDLEQRAFIIEGRLQELGKKEVERAGLLSVEVSCLLSDKTRLESDVSGLQRETETLNGKKSLLVESIATYSDVYDRVFARASVLDEVIGHVTRVNGQNISDAENLLGLLKKSVQEVIDINTANVATANVVINELPRVFFDLKRPATIKIPNTL